jgi:hypothetical protein
LLCLAWFLLAGAEFIAVKTVPGCGEDFRMQVI